MSAHFVQKAMNKPKTVVLVAHESTDAAYAREAAKELTSMVAVLDINSRMVGVEIVKPLWKRLALGMFVIGIVFIGTVGGFATGILLDDINPQAVLSETGVEIDMDNVIKRNVNYDRVTGKSW